MKRLFVVALAFGVLAVGTGGLMLHKHRSAARCAHWLDGAQAQIAGGFFASGIEGLTLYFSTTSCRGVADNRALELLARARPHVPLPEKAHLGQTLMLAKLGLRLESDGRDHQTLGAAALAAGNWREAAHHARRDASPRGALIGLAAAVALNDEDLIEESAARISKMPFTAFQIALSRDLLSARGLAVPSALMKQKVPADIARFAAFVLRPSEEPVSTGTLADLGVTLADDDLAVATMLLGAKGYRGAVVTLLDQPSRALPAGLLIRLARAYWLDAPDLLGNGKFLTRKASGAMPPEVFLMTCLQEWQTVATCAYRFDELEYKKRHGIHAASRWMTLLKALARGVGGAADAIDAMNAMPDMLEASPFTFALKAALLDAIAEETLANRYRATARKAGFPTDIPNSGQTLLVPPACGREEQACLQTFVDADPADIRRWQVAIGLGLTISKAQATRLMDVSPDEATLWRRSLGWALVRESDDATRAQALSVAREGSRLAPSDSHLHLIAAISYEHFGDTGAAVVALSKAVQADPDLTPVTLRLALGAYKRGTNNTPSALVHQWVSLTHLELRTRRAEKQADKLLMERLSLLAAFAEETKDTALARASYEAMLAIREDHHIALNNLAYLLMADPSELVRAYAMAEKAVALAPGIAEYKATLNDIKAAL
ncbi:MAG: hypothetical protein HWE25_00925 [Alphaproteobacteria bacterium]|nr:hypothetical protein [Alphaproteobacteria bacterium]